VFGGSSQRKCIVTRNIAETSLTIGGIVYVVDDDTIARTDAYPLFFVLDSSARPANGAVA
jgi:HrpA-like RNA helicase